MKNKNHIESVRIETKTDPNADASYLGTYSNQRNNRWAIERKDSAHGEYHCFNPNANNYAGCTDEECAKYCRQDYERAEALNRGEWQYVGISAKAVVVSAGGVIQALRSGGLWGIESDSDSDYLAEVARDELANLRTELEAFGFSARAINYAFRNVPRS